MKAVIPWALILYIIFITTIFVYCVVKNFKIPQRIREKIYCHVLPVTLSIDIEPSTYIIRYDEKTVRMFEDLRQRKVQFVYVIKDTANYIKDLGCIQKGELRFKSNKDKLAFMIKWS